LTPMCLSWFTSLFLRISSCFCIRCAFCHSLWGLL
jgi:hypothetical protein